MDRSKRRFEFALLAAVLAVGGCSGTNAVSSSESPSVMSAFPSRATYGVMAHYRVYRTRAENRPEQLVALQVQTPQSYLLAVHAVPVPYAAVRYPDGSIQRAGVDGTFDAAASSYARGRQLGAAGVPVRLSATVENASLNGNASIVAPSPAQEASTASGTIDDGTALQTRPAYAFTCDPAHYMRQRVLSVPAGTSWESPHFTAQADITYHPVLGYCGVQNSFFDDTYVKVVRHWTDASTIQVTEGQLLGCYYYGGPLRARSTFSCTVRTWYADATFNASRPWASNNDVALWFEAWHFTLFRDSFEDAHLALLSVR